MRRVFNPLAALLVVALSAGCSTVNVPTPVPCVSELPERPHVRSEADLLAMDRYTRTLAAWSDRLALAAYARELEAVLAGCRALPSP